MKPQWYLLTDTDGKKSVSFTMMCWTFVVLTIWLLLSVFEHISGLDVRAFDASGAAVWFAPIAALYWGRKGQASTTTSVVSTPTPTLVKPSLTASEEEEAAIAADIKP